MTTWRCWCFMWLLGVAGRQAQGQQETTNPIVLRKWYSSGDSNPHVLVRSRQPEVAQTLSVWSRRGIEALEKAWGREIPFYRGVPLVMVVTPDAERVELRTRRTENEFRQTLLIPEAAGKQDSIELANQLTLAMLQRMVLADTTEPSELWRNPPDWMVLGNRHHLLPGEGAAWFGFLMKNGRLVEVPPPEVIVTESEIRGNPMSGARAALLFRWIADQSPSSVTGERVSWAALAETRRDPAAFWTQVGGVTDLRELHLKWDLWLANQSRLLITSYALENSAMDRLEEWLNFYPAILGHQGEVMRYRKTSLPRLAHDPDAPNLIPMLTAWILRLETLRFRQGDDFGQMVDAYVKAASALQRAASSRRGRRERYLMEFQEAWASAEALRNRFRVPDRPDN